CVEVVAVSPAGLLGEGDPEQAEVSGLPVQVTGQLAGALPAVEVRQDLLLDELAHGRAQLGPFGRPEGVGHSRASGTSISRDRSHSPSALACGSNRACDATPSP